MLARNFSITLLKVVDLIFVFSFLVELLACYVFARTTHIG